MLRFFRSNVWLGIVTFTAILALFAALLAIRGLGAANADRERDRIAADVASCQRGNANRQIAAQQIRDVTRALVAAGSNPQRVEEVLSIVEPVLERTPVTDCGEVILGANPEVLDFPPPEAP